MKIEVGKFYKTTIGRKVRIYAIDGVGDFNIHGAVFLGTGWDDSCWNWCGKSIYDSCENIVSEWTEDKWFQPVPLTKEHGFNYISKSDIVEPGTYFLYFNNGAVIKLVNLNCYTPPEQDRKLAKDFNWITTSCQGYFEGTSMEDVRFISSMSMRTVEVYKEKLLQSKKDKVFTNIPIPKYTHSYYFTIQNNISAICSCGGKIDSHKPECPENQELMNEIHPFYILDESPQRYLGMPEQKKCECGSDSLGSPKHSEYCPKFKEE